MNSAKLDCCNAGSGFCFLNIVLFGDDKVRLLPTLVVLPYFHCLAVLVYGTIGVDCAWVALVCSSNVSSSCQSSALIASGVHFLGNGRGLDTASLTGCSVHQPMNVGGMRASCLDLRISLPGMVLRRRSVRASNSVFLISLKVLSKQIFRDFSLDA